MNIDKYKTLLQNSVISAHRIGLETTSDKVNYGKYFYERLASRAEIVAWVDRNYEQFPDLFGKKIESPDCIKKADFDILFVAIANGRIKKEVTDLCVRMGVAVGKIY